MESMRSCLDGQQQTLGHNLAPSGERRCARELPSRFVIGAEDRVIPAELQRPAQNAPGGRLRLSRWSAGAVNALSSLPCGTLAEWTVTRHSPMTYGSCCGVTARMAAHVRDRRSSG